ncbi:MAG: DUF5606 domain-containing protein, partial [Prevotellaceae bacterium]|nr:DUF5606 domain-containing protein [Prevotellaceae bacterium]
MQVDLQKILSITGHPGLYRYLSQARQGVIVENLIDGKRMRVPPTAKISTMSDITIFTNSDEDLMLIDVFRKIKDKTNGEQALSHKSSTEELMRYFEEIIPEYRKDKVFPSHVRKIIEWYNVLQEQG